MLIDNRLLFVSDMTFLSATEKSIMLQSIDNDANLVNIREDDIRRTVGRNVRPRMWSAEESMKHIKVASWAIKMHHIRAIVDGEAEYPPLLHEVEDRPFALFCRGEIECLTRRTVSVVGTRHVTPQGRMAAQEFAFAASVDGVSVVSGLAIGVDGAAHKGTVMAVREAMVDDEAGPLGKAIAVLPCGVDNITPSSHKDLAMQILCSHGCLISEYLPGTEAEAWRFVHRNRIIAGMSPATLVVEAPPGSGALITAQFAIDYNRDVMFHEAAFGDLAQSVSQQVKAQLEVRHAQGKVSKSKIENTAQRYIEDGAPIVKSYEDFVVCLNEAPGERAACMDTDRLFDGCVNESVE